MNLNEIKEGAFMTVYFLRAMFHIPDMLHLHKLSSSDS